MNIDRTDMGNVTVLRLAGDLDEKGVDVLRSSLYECLTQAKFQVVVNMEEVGFVSCLGLGVLVERLRNLRNLGGDMKLVGVNVATQRMFRMVGISRLFDTFESETNAVSVFQEAA